MASVLAAAGCYKPNVKSGGLECAAMDVCPDDLSCDTSQTPHLCVKPLPGAGGATGGTQGTGGKGGSGTGGSGGTGTGGKVGTGGTGGVACLPPVSSCTTTYVDGGPCDPVCNVGCASCDKKCSVNTAGTMTCNAVPAPRITNSTTICTITQTGGDVSTQSDNCAAGQVCIQPTTCGYLCYSFCRKDSDCTSANCGRTLAIGVKVCDAPFTDCDPTVTSTNGTNAPCNPAVPLSSCYLSNINGRTQCDCGSYAGSTTVGKSCSDSRDCYPGLVCYNATGKVGDATCRKICRLPTDGGAGSGCVNAASCTPMRLTAGGVGTVWGYCNEQ